MKATITGLMTLFNAGGSFYNDVAGRLFYSQAPDEVELPYAIFFSVSDVSDDVFAKDGAEVYIQFSLFSGASSPGEIMDMETHLSTMFKDVSFTVTGWTLVNMKRVQSSGPIYNMADVEAGTGFYWQTDVDFVISKQKS